MTNPLPGAGSGALRNPFPSIPTPNKTIDGLHATVAALQQAVALLVSNAQGPGQQTLASNAYVFAQSNQITQQINKATGVVSNKTVTLQEQVNVLDAEVATLTSEVNSFNGANIQAGTVASAALANGAVSARAQDIESGLTTATANINLGVAGDVLVFAAYLGTTAGPGAIISVQVDGGTTYTLIQTATDAGSALPGVGFILVPGLAAGPHTFVATAAVSGVNETNVQIAVLGLMR